MESSPQVIDLGRLDDAGFQQLYKDRIEPCFVANEADRLAAVGQFKQRLLIGGGVAAALALGGYLIWRQFDIAAVILFMSAFVVGIVAYQPLAKVGQTLKRQYCSAIADAMDAAFTLSGFAPPAFERLCELGLVPGFSRSSFEDLFSGTYKSSPFALYEAHLEQRRTDSKGRTRYTTVFRGQLVRMHFPREFLGVTIVRRDAGVFNIFGGGKAAGKQLERVRLVDSRLERAFEVWGTDQVEARYLLHPVMMERLLELETKLHGKRLRCAFEGGDVLVAVEGGNLFEPGDLFKPLVDPSRARRIVTEISGVFGVMDQVLTAQAQRQK
ncbi:DUF3137 domain-containing protein [Candidatus Viadribacter manganicus]|uniref:Galanin n=1 Tax=Candidatus Viadribacter manganicus TaxID=1759059 RepID=A0A1B1AME6_9PROT|nr:DUF3137 domain-containing protein [Candidatus Viadribacter manganicus]ANP47742.1 hypothetical protein ATE48_18480 [Candidatus Viadribacter manganicus]